MDVKADKTELRRSLFKIYNDVTKEIYGFGVVELKVNFVEDMIIFRTKHNRVSVLSAIETRYGQLKEAVDHALFSEFKRRLKEHLEQRLQIVSCAMLRDYDPVSRMAVTVVILANGGMMDGA